MPDSHFPALHPYQADMATCNGNLQLHTDLCDSCAARPRNRPLKHPNRGTGCSPQSPAYSRHTCTQKAPRTRSAPDSKHILLTFHITLLFPSQPVHPCSPAHMFHCLPPTLCHSRRHSTSRRHNTPITRNNHLQHHVQHACVHPCTLSPRLVAGVLTLVCWWSRLPACRIMCAPAVPWNFKTCRCCYSSKQLTSLSSASSSTAPGCRQRGYCLHFDCCSGALMID